jgi:hypothetical protein
VTFVSNALFRSPVPAAYSKTDCRRYDVEAGRHAIDIDGDGNNSNSEKGVGDTLESSEYTATT